MLELPQLVYCRSQSIDSHSLAAVTFANDEIASGRIAPDHKTQTNVSALPGQFGILVRPVLCRKSLLPFHELSLTFDRTKSRGRNHASNKRGNGQKEFVECNHDGYSMDSRL